MTYTVRMSEGETTLHWPPSAHPACVRRARLLPLHWLLLALTSVVAASPAQAQVRPAERTERFALSVHAALGL